ncbi:ankyrin repeat [Trichoderma arundinaceum]|uniref:Ankyrin repeat n=1 Tax=Trichoderma arundinaceum TaxID=490622 RepID=A0A395NI99_TRIAR|nr:ankyrin repeat [Trichoderma arundinaceum]
MGEDTFQWVVRTGGPWEHQLMNTADASCAKLSAAQKVLIIREKLGHITNWQGPSTKEAINLSLAIEAAADALLSSSSEKKLSWAIPITYITSDEYVFVEIVKHATGWKVKIEDIDALLSLWLYSSVLPYSSRGHNTGNARFNRGQESGLRLCGPTRLKETLLRDLQQWIPEYAPEIFTLRFLLDGDVSAEAVLRQQIVGFGMQFIGPDNSQEIKNPTESRDGGDYNASSLPKDMTASFEESNIFPANFRITQAHLAAIKENIMQWTPLHYACLEGNESMVESLIGLQFPSPVNFTGVDGVTPLHCAAKNGNTKVVSWLLSPPTQNYGVYSDRVSREREARDYNERCPIHWAVVAGHIGVVDLLKTDIGLEDRFGWTSLHLAAVYGHHEMVDFISRQPGVNMNKLDKSSRTPLHLAIEHGSAETVKLLLEAGANVNIASVNGATPLHVALGAKGGPQSKLDEVIEILLAASADPNAASLDGTTPLHLAAEHGANSTVHMLLEVGADANAISQDGTTPLHRAAINSKARGEIMQTLIKYGAKANPTNFRGETPQDIIAKHDILKEEALGDYEIQLRLLKQQNDMRRNATSHKTQSK